MVTRNDFNLPSGSQNDFDGYIGDAWFGPADEAYSQKAGAETLQLHLEIRGEELPAPITQGYSLGTKAAWKLAEGGRSVVSETNATWRAFQENSRAGQLVRRVLTLAGGGDFEKGKDWALGRGFAMTSHKFFVGLNFHWKREDLKRLDEGVSSVLLPSVWLDPVREVEVKGKPVGKQAVGGTITDEDTEKVVSLSEGKTPRELKLAVASSMKDNPALMNEVLNKDLIGRLTKEGRLVLQDGKFI